MGQVKMVEYLDSALLCVLAAAIFWLVVRFARDAKAKANRWSSGDGWIGNDGDGDGDGD